MFQSDFNIRNIANVVHSWMGYLYEVSEVKHLAAESSLRYPIVGLLERKDAITNIIMEIGHPCFEQKRVDFYWEDRYTKNYMEMKYIRDSKVDVQKILNDVFRLSLIDTEDAKRYFLVCGTYVDFQKYFQNVSQNESNQNLLKDSGQIVVAQSGNCIDHILERYFSFDKDKNKREVKLDTENDSYYKQFKEEYDSSCRKGCVIPNKMTISTELLQSINKGLKSAVAVWEIERVWDK